MELSESLNAKLEKAKSADEVIRICAQEGIELTLEQLMAPEVALDAELDAEELGNVSGGRAASAARLAILVVKKWWELNPGPFPRDPRKKPRLF